MTSIMLSLRGSPDRSLFERLSESGSRRLSSEKATTHLQKSASCQMKGFIPLAGTTRLSSTTAYAVRIVPFSTKRGATTPSLKRGRSPTGHTPGDSRMPLHVQIIYSNQRLGDLEVRPYSSRLLCPSSSSLRPQATKTLKIVATWAPIEYSWGLGSLLWIGSYGLGIYSISSCQLCRIICYRLPRCPW